MAAKKAATVAQTQHQTEHDAHEPTSEHQAHRTRSSGRNGSPTSTVGRQNASQKHTLPQSTTFGALDPNAPPSFIPIRMWQQWIHARCREDPNSSTVFLDSLHAQAAATIAKKSDPNRRRRRHHRLTCIYHFKSTNNVARQMGRAKLFPTAALHKSYFRVQHAIHGASIHGNIDREDGGDDAEKCFVVPDMCEVVSIFSIPPISSPQLKGGSGGGGASFALLPDLSAIHEDVPLPGMGNHSEYGTLVGNTSVGTASDGGVFSLTQPATLMSRACTPNLDPFKRPDRTLMVHGEFADCSCSDRSTDDEGDLGSEIRADRAAKRKGVDDKLQTLRDRRRSKRSASRNSDGRSSEDDEARSDEERRAARLDARTLDRDMGEPLIADRAAVALRYWQDRFRKANVEARAHLNHRLAEREQHRAFVTNERTHLHLLASQAEGAAKQIALVRQARSTTPTDASVWAPVFDTVEGDRKYLSVAQEQFISFCEFCVGKQFPSDDHEMEFILELRQICLSDAVSKPSSASFLNRSQTPPISHSKRSSLRSGSQRPSLSDTRPPNRLLPPVTGVSRPPLPSMGEMPGRRLSKLPTTTTLPIADVEKSVFSVKVDESHPSQGRAKDVPTFDRFNESTAMQMFVKYGPMFVRTRGGVAVANHLREECKVSIKEFLTLFFGHEEDWGPFCPEMGALKKRLNQSTV
eukprot:GILI01022096.1.p1 GENE.GILI01022096.1~~GILI01022096.1.p1  ORF type:complete len:715 (+),score=104.62 GILI01022096.1:72-2147(+)